MSLMKEKEYDWGTAHKDKRTLMRSMMDITPEEKEY